MAQAYLIFLPRLVSAGKIPVISEVTIAAFKDNNQDAARRNNGTPFCFALYYIYMSTSTS